MKRKSQVAPLQLQNDSVRMKAFTEWANARALLFVRPTEYQVKIGRVNYYPDKETIVIDGVGRYREQGLDGLINALTMVGVIKKPRSP